jgi:mono/diheme cytochrome c family protein
MFPSLARTAGLAATAVLLLAAGGGVLGPSMAKAQTPWVAPAPEKAKKSPLPNNKKTVEQGEKIAKVNCVACHGVGGKGDGPAAVALNPKPADWTSKRVQDDTDGELFWKITNGRGAMPAWRHLPESDRWALVQYIRSLAGK